MKCVVCGSKEMTDIYNCSINLQNKKVYCFRCVLCKVEPYKDIVNYLAKNKVVNYKQLSTLFIKDIVDNTLEFNNITLQKLFDDVKKEMEK